jgi:hypothetical protein
MGSAALSCSAPNASSRSTPQGRRCGADAALWQLPRKRAAQLPPRNAEKIKRRNGTRSASQALEGGISVLAPNCASILFVATVGLNAMALQKVSDYGFICRRERCCESALDSLAGRQIDTEFVGDFIGTVAIK